MPKEAPKPVRGVYENPVGSGIWWVNFYADGRRRREKVGRRRDAIDLYHRRKADARAGVKLPESLRAKKPVFFEDLATDAMQYSKDHKKSHRGDLSNLASLLPAFKSKKADQITPTEINTYLASRTDLKPATLNRYRSTLSMIFQEGIRNGRCTANPARLVRLRREDNARIRFLSYQEEQTIRAMIIKRCPCHEPAFTVAIETGMRLSEQHSLKWTQVDLERRQITLDQTKNGTRRVVVLSARALQALSHAKAQERKDEAGDSVFLTRYGVPVRNPKAWFKLVMADAVEQNAALADVTWHVFRHTFISRLVMAGVDLRTVQELAGHKSISMTVRYSHLSPDHRLSAIDRLGLYRETQENSTLNR